MIARALLRLALPIVLALILVSIFDALATANQVGVTATDDLRVVIDANALKPPECAALNLSIIVVGSGTFTAHRWRTDESDDTLPYTHHPYAYALSNPLLYSDP